MHEARLYEKLNDRQVSCHLCAHRCLIGEGKRGVCQVRENQEGALYSLVYGLPISCAVDPIEKKPLFHFFPGSSALSFATAGCNFRCSFCQNWQISQVVREQGRIFGQQVEPEELIGLAQSHHCHSIAYTYTEPTIFFEYAYDTAVLADRASIKNVYITNGYMTSEMLDAFGPHLHAANVDLKAFRDDTYRRVCGARLQPVLDAIQGMKRRGVWVEITTLIVPGLNDSPQELADIARFIAHDVGIDTPWHVSRFHPDYHMHETPPTPLATLRSASKAGLAAGLRYVYQGNVPGSNGEDTVCYNCHKSVILRRGFHVIANHLQPGHRCPHCGVVIDGMGLNTPSSLR